MASGLAVSYAGRPGKVLADELSDEDLLEQFLNADELTSQEAFTALVERHGPMVLGICRHVLSQHHDAEDAFQATFLVLARKGGSIRNRRVLAGWLHEVAHRIAVKARASAVRRRTKERQGVAMSPPAIEQNKQDETAAWNELRPVLHAEVEQLPERYRIPVILSYLEGKTNEEVAALLRWPVGTVKGRLSRARELLRSRLLRRGMTLSAAFLMTALSHGTVFAEVVPRDLVRRTVRLAARYGARAVPADGVDPHGLVSVERGLDVSGRAPMGVKRASFRLTRREVGLITVAILTAAIAIATATWAAAFNPGGFSPLHGAFSSFLPAGGAAGAGAHCR